MGLVSVDTIRDARRLLESVVRMTPMEHARDLEPPHGGPVHFKCENLQRTGSFKIRGAYTRIHGLSEEERARGVVAASAGNHAQGVALAASLLGSKATVFMPERAPLPKLAATRGYGADVHLHGEALEETLAEAVAFAERTGAVFIHPFDHPDIIAGQGTVGLEILEQVPDVATVLVATGGGGLVGGVASALKGVRPDVRVVGVQAEGAAAFPLSLSAGNPVRLERTQTMADGIAVGAPGPVTFEHVRSLVDDVVTVGEESLSRAVLLCLERRKLVVEPAGAAAVAALLEHSGVFEPPVVAILSGGNVDPLLLLQIIQHGMTAAGRYLSLRLRVPDRPGSLAGVLSRVSELGANVLDVEHSRISGRLAMGEVEIALKLETRGPEHCADVAAQLQRAGFRVLF
ncbi:threonine ammonia-lyase [Saccharomonospora piscinae]|uniref:L-threonine dehydratase catabolic TdcB n=1 Tax=Saccharomonospora piscinae TaxID=687388 RepID=A0A1V9A5Q4_SACPI|nr:threonine ammonia-lyase [Saccharomonospora piscinae]OQO92472.1 threonine ammonia-lyase [Saccharomonospora piscinae]TLW91822.1 threonine ammonia-lyase [Saccharomonospora piscinae]